MLTRLLKIVEGLRARGYDAEAEALQRVIGSLRNKIPRDATIQEVVVKTLIGVVGAGVTLDGRLVDVLGHLAATYGVSLGMHPVVLVILALGGRDNQDREHNSDVLDEFLATVVDVGAQYQPTLYAIAVLARQHGLTFTADRAVQLMRDLEGHSTPEHQARVIQETRLSMAPQPDSDDELGWVTRLLLTLASVAALAAVARQLTGSVGELIDFLDGMFGGDP